MWGLFCCIVFSGVREEIKNQNLIIAQKLVEMNSTTW